MWARCVARGAKRKPGSAAAGFGLPSSSERSRSRSSHAHQLFPDVHLSSPIRTRTEANEKETAVAREAPGRGPPPDPSRAERRMGPKPRETPTIGRPLVSLELGDRRARAGELAGDGDGGHGRALVAPPHPRVGPVQAPLRRPGDRHRGGGLALLAALDLAADPGRVAVVPRGLDQKAPRVPRARPGDRAEPTRLAAGVL